MLLSLLVLWGCGAKHETAQPASGSDDANPEATVNGKITAHQLESDEEPEEPDEQEEEEDPEEQDEPDDPEEEQDEDEMEDEPDPEVSAPAPNYEEWTAEPPTLGKPKVPGPPYPYLEENSRRGLYDQLRKYRWMMWETERMLDRIAAIELEWVENWEAWEARGGGIAFARELRRKANAGEPEAWRAACSGYRYISYPLRRDDRTLEKLVRERKHLNAFNPLWAVIGYGGNTGEQGKIKRFIQYLGQDLQAYGEEKAYTWYKQVKGLWSVHGRTKGREHKATNPVKRWRGPFDRLRIALCNSPSLCYSPSLIHSQGSCVDNPVIRLYTSGMDVSP